MTPHATSTAQVDYSMCVDEVSSSAHAVADSMEVDVSEAVFALNVTTSSSGRERRARRILPGVVGG